SLSPQCCPQECVGLKSLVAIGAASKRATNLPSRSHQRSVTSFGWWEAPSAASRETRAACIIPCTPLPVVHGDALAAHAKWSVAKRSVPREARESARLPEPSHLAGSNLSPPMGSGPSTAAQREVI